MEEMNIGTDNATTIVEEVTSKLTFKENAYAYALTGVFATGVITIGYLGYKGGKKLGRRFLKKKVTSEQPEIINVESEEIHEVKNETE